MTGDVVRVDIPREDAEWARDFIANNVAGRHLRTVLEAIVAAIPPDEPTGLGAAVTAAGFVFIRWSAEADAPWISAETSGLRHWKSILNLGTPVVLSPGVEP